MLLNNDIVYAHNCRQLATINNNKPYNPYISDAFMCR